MPGQEIIDVLVAFDAETILQEYAKDLPNKPDKPITVGGELIHMFVKQGDVVNNQGASELTIKAVRGDVIRWRETTFSRDANYSALLWKYEGPDNGCLSLPPGYFPLTVDAPVLSKIDEPDFSTQPITDHYITTNVQNSGKFAYQFHFQIIWGRTAMGYFKWDPFFDIE